MIGVYDFCGHYEWTFSWLEAEGGDELVRQCWAEAIAEDSQSHALELIRTKGFEGMKEYWSHSLNEEAAGYNSHAAPALFRIDIHDCPSKGFLLRNGLEQYHDYCDHCIGWIGAVMKQAGFVVDHEHNHCGQCCWEFRRVDDHTPASAAGELVGEQDVRVRSDWNEGKTPHDVFIRATGPESKESK